MDEIRCKACNKKLAVRKKPMADEAVEIKCPRCKTVNRVP